MAYCCHCMTKIDSPDMPFCPECGKKHSFHQAKTFELPAGTMLSNKRYLVGECKSSDDFLLTYIGYDLKMGRKVAVKEIFYKNTFDRNTEQNDKPLNVTYSDKITFNEIMKQISRECISLSESDALTNIAKVYDWFSENNTAYIVSEFVSETSLYERADEIGGYDWEKLYTILKPLLESLVELHDKNLYHKNIKPQNIKIRKTLNNTEELVLADFGFARPKIKDGLIFDELPLNKTFDTTIEATAQESKGTAFDSHLQSTPYEPPEQRNHSQNEGEYTDIYSIAATIYYAVTGAEPIDKISKNIDEIFPLLKPMRKSGQIPENVYYALKYALQPDYNTRCKTIETFITRLETVQKPTTVKTGNIPKDTAPTAPPASNGQKPEPDCVPNIVNDKPKPYTNYAGNPNVVQKSAAAQNNEAVQEYNPKGKGIKKEVLIAIIAAACLLVAGIAVTAVLIFNSDAHSSGRTKVRDSKSSTPETAESTESESNSSELSNDDFTKDSTKIALFETDAMAVNEYVREAVNTYITGITATTWNGQTADEATMHDVCVENYLDDSDNFYSRTIGNIRYSMVWTETNQVKPSGGDFENKGYEIDGNTLIRDLAEQNLANNE